MRFRWRVRRGEACAASAALIRLRDLLNRN